MNTFPPTSTHYIGLMSGTSLDGVDGVLVDFAGPRLKVIGHHYLPFSEALRADLLALQRSGEDELARMMLAGQTLTRLYAQCVQALGQKAPGHAIAAIGAHGQTIRHQPQLGFSVQLLQPALLAELTQIDVVCDFRNRDIAAGGQGAPLVPAFHQAVFAAPAEQRIVLNIGGFANLTYLAGASPHIVGFDTGPGNVLMDAWCQQHLGQPYDAAGAWARGGQVVPALLARLLSEPFFHRPPPKSTGRDDFHLPWLARHLQALESERGQCYSAQEVQATLCALSVESMAQAIQTAVGAKGCDTVIVCGGGALNEYLCQCLQARLQQVFPRIRLSSSANFGLPPTQVEAVAFAWLAQRFMQGQSANLPSVTGARGLRRLGAWYPA